MNAVLLTIGYQVACWASLWAYDYGVLAGVRTFHIPGIWFLPVTALIIAWTVFLGVRLSRSLAQITSEWPRRILLSLYATVTLASLLFAMWFALMV